MTREEKIQEEIEKTLDVLDNLPNIDANPFLFTRLNTLVENGAGLKIKYRRKSFAAGPIMLCIILLINLITAIFLFQSGTVEQTSETSLVNSLANDYKISQTNLEKINQE